MQENLIQNVLENNEDIVKFLNGFLDSSNQTILLVSPDETYLSVMARLLISKLENGTFDKNSLTYKKIKNENAVDVFYYPKEKQLVVENANEIIDNLYLTPLEFKNKYYVVKNIDNATIIAQNKLLKSLEEPPHYARFILLSTNIDGVLNTIKSRATKIYLPSVSDNVFNEIIESVKENEFKITNEHVLLAKELSQKKLGKFFEYINNTKLTEIFNLCESLLSSYSKSSQILNYSSKIINLKNNTKMFFEVLNVFLRDVLVFKTNPQFTVFKSKNNFYEKIQNSFSSFALTKQIGLILNAQKKLKYNAVAVGVVDNFLIEFMEAKLKCK